MICPKCNSDTLNEEKDMVVCSNCGFKATLREYNIWKKIYKAKPQRTKKIVSHENEETYTETYTNIGDYVPLWVVLALVILLIIIASIV